MSASTSAGRASGPGAARAPPTPGELAWLALGPCALALLLLILVLGPPLGRVLFPPVHRGFWPWIFVAPEPTEHSRYLLALLGPLALSGAVVLGMRRVPLLPPRHVAVLVHATQAVLATVAVGLVISQHFVSYGRPLFTLGPPFHRAYFTWTTLAVAVGVALALAAAMRRQALVDRVAAFARETPARRIGALSIAVLTLVPWMLTAFNTEASIQHLNQAVHDNIPYWLDEAFAVLNGLTPLVSIHEQYSNLWPYAAAGSMSIFGASLTVYILTMIAGAVVGLVALYATLRRVARSSIAALVLYVPILATGFFTERGPPDDRYGPSNLLSEFPMRYTGPLLLAWLTARHLDGARPRRLAGIAAFAGITVVANPEFGLPAVGAMLAAIVWTEPRWERGRAARLLGEAAGGSVVALAAVALLTLASAGSLPHLSWLFTFSRLYGLSGFALLPMPSVGFHLVVYITFAAAIVVATVRAVGRDQDTLMTGMLAWTGVFGLGIGSYFVGRSHPEVLIDLFLIWALAVALLLIVAVRAVLARATRRPTVAELALLAAFGLLVCSVAQTPTPWSQISRLEVSGPPARLDSPFYRANTKRFVADATRRGERLLLLGNLGHRMAYELGLRNVSPYSTLGAMPTREQLLEAVEALSRAGGSLLFAQITQLHQEEVDFLLSRGFRPVGRSVPADVLELTSEG